MIVARQQHIDQPRARDFKVSAEVRMRDGDNHVSARFAQSPRLLADRGHLVEKAKIAGRRHQRGCRQRHAEDANLDRTKIDQCAILVIRQDRPVRRPQIGGECGIFCQLRELEIIVLAEIEFMVARHEDIRRHDIQQLHRVLALIEAGHQRGREHVARMGIEQRDTLRPFGPRNGGQPREAAAAAHFRHLVDIVDQQQSECGADTLIGRLRQRLLRAGGHDRGCGDAGTNCDGEGLSAGQPAVWFLGHRDLLRILGNMPSPPADDKRAARMAFALTH